MKITKKQLRRIIKEEKTKLAEQGFHSMSPAGKALANSIKRKFMRMYPDASVGIDGRGGFITVNGKKAIDMSQATGRRMSDDEMIEKMHTVYAATQIDPDVPTADSRMDTFREGKMKITKRQLRRIIKEEMEAKMGDVQVGDEVDVIGGVMVGAVGEVAAMGSEDGKQIVVLNLLRPAADERYKDLGPQVIIQPDFIEKRTDLFAKRMGRKAENPRRGPMKYYGVKDV